MDTEHFVFCIKYLKKRIIMIKNNDYIVIIRFQSIFLVEMHLKLIFSPAFKNAIFGARVVVVVAARIGR